MQRENIKSKSRIPFWLLKLLAWYIFAVSVHYVLYTVFTLTSMHTHPYLPRAASSNGPKNVTPLLVRMLSPAGRGGAGAELGHP